MAKRKTVDNTGIEPAAAAADVKNRSSKSTTASKPKATPAATHKRVSKKTINEESAAPVSAATPRIVVHEDVARLAYSYWESRGFQGGDPAEDWFRAERELSELA